MAWHEILATGIILAGTAFYCWAAYVRYVDMLRDTSFVEDDFFDADHLNWQGAKKWTLKLDEMINASMSSLY